MKVTERTFSDEELFSALEHYRPELNPDMIQKARDGDGKTLCKIGEKYRQKKEYFRALAWFCKSSAQNNSNGQIQIGSMYQYGYGVSQDYKIAMTWYLKAAKTDGNKEAQYNIGELYQNGFSDVPRNIDTAIKWYKKAANQGQSNAQYALGWTYEIEEERKDLQKAAIWYQKSIDNGNTKGKEHLERLNKQGYYG